MAIICPTVLADEPHAFREQMERIAPFAQRVQIDLTDGLFARTPTVALEQVWWPENIKADLHLMYERPDLFYDAVKKLTPQLVIVHAESSGNFSAMADSLHDLGIKVGVGLLQDTKVDAIQPALADIDHVLIFSGDLGHFGGHADLSLLEKVKQLKQLKPTLEIGWDGGINDDNAKKLMDGGVDVLNVGGFIQRAADPRNAYDTLVEIVGTVS